MNTDQTNIQIGNVGRDFSGAVGGGDVTQTINQLSDSQRMDFEEHRRAVAQEVLKGEGKGDIQKILSHLQSAAQISTKLLAPLILGFAGRWVADLLPGEPDSE